MKNFIRTAFMACAFWGVLILSTAAAVATQSPPLSPSVVVASCSGATLYVACATANRILRLDAKDREISGVITVPETPLGLALSPKGKQLFVTCASPESKVCIIDLKKWKTVGTIAVGHTAMAPVASPDGKTLYVCNRFNNDVSIIDLLKRKETCRVTVQREPVAAALTKDGKFLLVANCLQNGRADLNYVAAAVSVIDTAANKVIKEIQLPTGSESLNDIQVSPDGRYAAVTHVVGRFNRLPTHVTDGWINVNALTIIDLIGMRIRGTMLLDDHYRGAANSWGIAWSSDGSTLVVTHAGINEISVIDFSKLIAHWPALPATYDPVKAADFFASSKAIYELPDDLPFFSGSRLRIKLPSGDLGPRAVAVVDRKAYIANYYSDTLTVINLDAPNQEMDSISLGPKPEMDLVRKGEFYFNDATICYDGWQSCASCHPGDARADGLNWDLLNDGIGNPKNTKSLLLATRMSPVMSLGVRADARTAIRAGIGNILFAHPTEDVVNAINAYLQSLKPVPSPFLVHGKLSESAGRGERIFVQAGCAECHVPGLYTDLHPHDVGTRASFDKPTDQFYTPTLIEVWRTAPYLHDGSAGTIRDVVTSRNPHDEHGITSNLSNREVNDLCEYVLSL